jgi:peptidoglycan/xylan/chitin deacetylase (PgdA/CDA1 family)
LGGLDLSIVAHTDNSETHAKNTLKHVINSAHSFFSRHFLLTIVVVSVFGFLFVAICIVYSQYIQRQFISIPSIDSLKNISWIRDNDRGISERKLESILQKTASSSLLTAKGTAIIAASATYTPQYILLSFDGSKSVAMWKETRDFAERLRKEGKPISFTYFINGVYFITRDTKSAYVSPTGRVGGSMIGYAESQNTIKDRIEAINTVIAEGHEIGSHAAGHYDGSQWTQEQWAHEFEQQNNLLFSIQANNSSPALPSLRLLPTDIVGFRAPELGVNDNLYAVLQKHGYLYDASGVAKMTDEPYKDTRGIWRIPLATIPFGKNRVPVLSMDYSIWMHQSRAQEMAVRGTPLWDSLYQDTLAAYKNYFEVNYRGARAPVVIGHHFSQWNDGVYWQAMKSFAESVCGMPEVRCATMREYALYRDVIEQRKTDSVR